ncbi:MAG: DUF937 domain-containing protein [Acidobacteria bacterium]|nr:DUF937 domain-containing protein [Acidobacteriota bacterium]
MQDLIGGLLGAMGGDEVKKLSSVLGADSQTTEKAMSAAMPALLGALSRNAASSGGASALAGALDRDHDGSILDDIGGLLAGGDTGAGASILGHVLGDREPAVAANVARNSGMDLSSVQKLLPMLAPLVLGALGKQKRQSGLDASGLASQLFGAQEQVEREAPGMLGALLDADGDGDSTDDILKLGAGLLGGMFGKR